ncbi:DUF2267 domain-containing protein [Streptomyces sp. NPDC050759]|uniref:DUF2267 domain-containing protein n=1 Tax=Streptomyces sp. NPDC050759 TaxID=3365635 RepID=UPI0037A72DE6
MRYDEFIASVRDRGEYATAQEAEQVTVAVLKVLASRLTAAEAKDLAAQLPGPLGDALGEIRQEGQAESFGIQEFCRRIAELTGARPRTAEWDAGAVLSTLADTVSGGELNQILSQLPSGYADLFGKPELSQ